MELAYAEGIGWGDAKRELFSVVNKEILPIREKYLDLPAINQICLNDLFAEGSYEKVRPEAKELVGETTRVCWHLRKIV
jgi:tryptophanyl-tRNA synthetase